MTTRQQITTIIDQLEDGLKSLEISYEQYFLGLEKRAPEQKRQRLSLVFRQLSNKYIPQTDLKFRLKGLSGRFQSFSGYWDRTMRLIEEGKYQRHIARLQRREAQNDLVKRAPGSKDEDPLDNLYEQLVEAHRVCNLKIPDRQQVLEFLDRQNQAIKKKFGDRKVEYAVTTENGKPKIKVRAKE